MQILYTLTVAISGILFCYSLLCAFYNLLFSIASLFVKTRAIINHPKHTFAVFIPSYKEDNVILESVSENLRVADYPKDRFKMVVIADQLLPQTVSSLKALSENLEVHEVFFKKSTKVKALNSALQTYQEENFDYVVVLDADNVMDKNFLKQLNSSVNRGMKAIQGRRKAKNRNNSLSILDGLSEEINNSIFRKGGNALGLSSPISGSGMAFEYTLLSDIFKSEDALGGFDKMLQVRLLERRVKIHYVPNAIVYDEKTEEQEVFRNQRKRWLNSHFTYFYRFVGNGLKGLRRLNLDLFNLTIFIHGFLPRSFNAIIMASMVLISAITPPYLFLKFSNWVAIFAAFILANLLAIPKDYWSVELFKAGLTIPKTMINMFKALLKRKESNKSFLHTPHKKHGTNE